MPSFSTKTSTSILVVHDDFLIQKMVTAMLRHAGYEVTIAADGCEALALAAVATPDLIISDVIMPNMDGFELLRRLRAKPATKGIPIILLTAKGDADDVVSGLDRGTDDYLTTPFEMKVLLARVSAKIERQPVPIEQLRQDRQTDLLLDKFFAYEAQREIQRSRRGGTSGCLAYLALAELEHLKEQFGPRVEAEIAKQIADLVVQKSRPLDIIGRDREGFFALLLPETNPHAAEHNLRLLSEHIMGTTFIAGGMQLRLTPIIGFSFFSNDKDFVALRDESLTALDYAATQLDLVPKLYEPVMGYPRQHVALNRWVQLRRRWKTPFQFALTLVLGWVIPYCVYVWFDYIGHDISQGVYILIVIALCITAFLIWTEGFIAMKVVHPPEPPSQPYPPASAIIAAYLPNEAATIVETVEAYNTPSDLPIETVLRQIAARDARFLPLRVEDSTSKAQNVNFALAEVSGEFVGVFDADHHPQPQNFMRAWRWLSSGYDVVQGHCQVRNGDEAWVAQMVSVEFEVIYAVSHPGRARLYNFGVFGGSNGYWKTELLRQTRMRGYMLTEDIDSSVRITEAGNKIASDPLLVSRELAPLTLPALWNQRMRWAQGWYQVSKRHFWKALLSRKLTLRQKTGIVWLLGWSELYPWISVQMFPLVAFWAIKYGGLNKLDWLIPIFVLTTVFTLSVGPGQTLFAYLLAAPEVRKHKRWFIHYFFYTTLFYTAFKNTIGRIAQFKEIMGDRNWKITPRARAKSKQAHGS
jgi:DNA-binding response OmpR family regulator/cellulose synthase/poly-beta-1,6-N-acetylglucosamine synthase-like glycosyltransferase